MVFFFAMTVFKKHSVSARKHVYYVFQIVTIIFSILIVLAILAVSLSNFYDQVFLNFCTNVDPAKFTDAQQCEAYMRKMTIVGLCLGMLIGVPIRLALGRVLKYGWLEQKKLAEEHEARGAEHLISDHERTQPHHAGPETHTTAGYYQPADDRPTNSIV